MIFELTFAVSVLIHSLPTKIIFLYYLHESRLQQPVRISRTFPREKFGVQENFQNDTRVHHPYFRFLCNESPKFPLLHPRSCEFLAGHAWRATSTLTPASPVSARRSSRGRSPAPASPTQPPSSSLGSTLSSPHSPLTGRSPGTARCRTSCRQSQRRERHWESGSVRSARCHSLIAAAAAPNRAP